VSSLAPLLSASDPTLRWRDTAGASETASVYGEAFRSTFSYGNTTGTYAGLTWTDRGTRLTGTLTAHGLKPNMAYQVKLVGKTKVTSARTAPSATKDPLGWASWQLGHNGRWWCDTDGNVTDAGLSACVAKRHNIFGYLLFDFVVTDPSGNADASLVLDSTYHVLWRTGDRARGANDGPARASAITRGAWGYGLSTPVTGPTVSIYGEWEPTRALPGALVMTAGTYPVKVTMTEESFHETADYCGSWPTVLGTDISFTISKARVNIALATP
jgi:hypothetical protein